MTAPPGDAVRRELRRLLDGFVALHGDRGLPRQPHDPRWPSPCEVGLPGVDGHVAWRPVPRESPPDWSGLEAALEAPLHPELAAFYGAWWSDCIPVRAEEGGATLIQVWSPQDFDRLVENLLGHALQKRGRNEPLTLFFACTDEGDLVLSVDNASGRVVLEQPGEAPQRELAPGLAELLARMQPAATSPSD